MVPLTLYFCTKTKQDNEIKAKREKINRLGYILKIKKEDHNSLVQN